jgi:hypothetical protein
MENASAAFLDAVRKSMRAIRSAIGTPTVTPELLTSAEKLRYESYLRREDTNAAIVKLARDGLSIKQIVRRLGHSRNLVRQALRGGRTDVYQTRQRSLDAYQCSLRANGAAAVAMVPNSGVVCMRRGSGDLCVPLATRQHVEIGRKRSANSAAKGSFGQNHRAADDHQTKLHDQG